MCCARDGLGLVDVPIILALAASAMVRLSARFFSLSVLSHLAALSLEERMLASCGFKRDWGSNLEMAVIQRLF